MQMQQSGVAARAIASTSVGGIMQWDVQFSYQKLKSPRSWTILTRRLFLVGFPIAVPIWAVAILGTLLAMLILDLVSPLRKFWSAPPKRLTYSPYSSANRNGKIARLDEERKRREAA